MTIFMPQTQKPNLVLASNVETYRKAERGTLVFAVFNITLTSLLSVCSAVGAVFWFCTFIVDDLSRPSRPPTDSDALRFFFTYILFAAIILILFFSLVAFMFACFLIDGVCKKKPEHIKAYFVYGVVVLVLSLGGTAAWTIMTNGSDLVTLGIVTIVLVLYSMILSMIRVTYRSYEQSKMLQYGDQLLVVATETSNKI